MKRLTLLPSTDLSPFQKQGTIDRLVTAQHPGRVYFQATYWPARLSQTVELNALNPGDLVEVIGREGLTLLVKPLY